jgi:SAM-dependent methyltransferase
MRMTYQSRRYARMNFSIEADRHLRRVRTFLGPRPNDRILDVGCGRGWVTQRVQRLAPATTGIDLSVEAVSIGVTHGLRVMDAQKLDFADASFDKIYSLHAIEHIPDLAAVFSEMDRVLKPGGSVLLAYPAEPIRGMFVVSTAIILFGNPLRARDIHIHKLSPRSLRPHLAGTSLRIVRSSLQFLLLPQWITLLRKEAPVVGQLTPCREQAQRVREAA